MSHTVEIPEEVGEALRTVAGIGSRNGGYELIAIELDALSLAGTLCGKAGNQPFNREAIRILEERNVTYAAAIVDDSMLICSMAVLMDREAAEMLSVIVNAGEGSLRLDSEVAGWQIFESE